MIAISPYDRAWPEEFAGLAARLAEALGGLAVSIDHIGSTAVPGLEAKDVIDIQVTVRALEPAVEAALASLGYMRLANIDGDHRPPGAAGPDGDWRKWFFGPPAGQRRTNLHVRVAGKPNQRYPLLFRDYLRAHPVAAGAYGQIKRQLARYHRDDIEAYYDIKDPACDLIWCAAEAWDRARNESSGA
ncbi:MAG TPA: GrpB family protein [Herpetosiphonaceae bacterium]|nr:GrpB family protein [Herpetosiphonaceae bacterium]